MNSLTFLPPTNSSSKGILKANGNLALKKGGGLKSTQTKIHFATLKKKTEKKNTLLQESSRPQCKVRRFDCFFNLYPAKHPPPPKKKKTIFSQKTRRFFFLSKSSAPHGHVGAHGSYARSSHGGLFRLQRIDRPLRGASLWLAI